VHFTVQQRRLCRRKERPYLQSAAARHVARAVGHDLAETLPGNVHLAKHRTNSRALRAARRAANLPFRRLTIQAGLPLKLTRN